MYESSEHDLHVVEGLIAAIEAGVGELEGFLGAAGAPHVQARREAAAELRVEVERLHNARAAGGLLSLAQRVFGGLRGGEPAPSAGGAHGDPTQAIEAHEQALQARFDAARADDRLSGPVRDAVLRAYDGVKTGQDAARQRWLAMRDDI